MELSPPDPGLLALLRLAGDARSQTDLERVVKQMLRVGLYEIGADAMILRIAEPAKETMEVQTRRPRGEGLDAFVDGLLRRARGGPTRGLLRLSGTRLPPPFQVCRAVSLPGHGMRGVLCALSRRKGAFGRAEEKQLEAIGLAATLAVERFHKRYRTEHVVAAERERIARVLHDGPLQLMVNALQLLRLAAPPPRRMSVRRVLKNLEGGIREVREIMRGLRSARQPQHPRDIQDLVARFGEGASIPVDVRWNVRGNVFSPLLQSELFYIIREALTNVYQHASAGRVQIKASLRRGVLDVEVRDDGVGFDVGTALRRSTAYGLHGLQERARSLGGRATIRSRPRGGTVVRVKIPASGVGVPARRPRSGPNVRAAAGT